MNAAINDVKVIGNLTRDPETVGTSENAPTKFTLAVNTIKNQEPEYVECVAFGKNGENVRNWTKKGQSILVQGHLDVNEYEDKNGVRRKSTNLIVETFQNLSPKPAAAEAAA